MFKNFSEIETGFPPAPNAAATSPPVRAESLAPARAPAISEVTYLKAEIARREAALGKEYAFEHINLLRVKRLTREIKLLRRRLLMLGGDDGPQTQAA